LLPWLGAGPGAGDTDRLRLTYAKPVQAESGRSQ
jgi:hypothetical protein